MNTKNVTHVYDHYFKYDEITSILKGYVEKYPGYCTLESNGKTLEGRDIWMFSLTDLRTGGFADKPAYCVTGNIHAGEVTGSSCAMYFLDVLLTNKDDPEIARILRDYTVYCVPRISPDGSELYLTTPEQLRSINTMHPYEELQPGVQPEDIDGDGVIRQMRVKSPNGIWRISDKDPRIMTKRRPDETEGEFYNVYSEGIIVDFDGADIQPAPGKFGNDLNRNFPLNWLPENKQAGSGAFALSNIESRTLADFIYSHKNICSVLNFHTMGGQYIYPPGYKASAECPREDMERYRAIAKMATEETGFITGNIKDDYVGKAPMSVVGAFDDFVHFAMGIIDMTCECWDLDPRCGYPHKWPRPLITPDEEQEEKQVARMKWLDDNCGGEGFKNWTKFDHPQLGEVEIGGLDNKLVVQNPPVKFLPEEVEKHTRFLLRAIKTLPRITFQNVKTTALGGDNYKIEAELINLGYLPTYVTREAIDVRKARPLTVTIEGAEPVTGKAKQEIGHLQGFSGVAAMYGHVGPATMRHEPFVKKLDWIVKAPAGSKVTITASCPRAGKATETVTL